MDTILDTVAPARRAGRRPNFPRDFKRQVVEATFQPGASVSLIAREHDVNANLVFRWQKPSCVSPEHQTRRRCNSSCSS
ncbi:transposase [Pseudomonas aeruginosa]|uniref:transposase n=2 Tax=Pseudomonas aeruginosa TaxID=287 RepID=UPI0008FB2060